MAAEDFIITRKRKKYKFAKFAEFPNCYEANSWAARLNSEYFDANRPLIIEMGAGTATFLVEYARLYPDKQFVAIDVKADRLQTGARQALESGLTNIVFIRAHASQLSELFAPHTVSGLWLTFSDPYPKKRHVKHRLTHPHFITVYRQLLVPDGLLHMKTDNQALFQWSLEQLVSCNAHITELSHDLHENEQLSQEYKIMTTYEKRFLREGLPIYYLSASFG